MDIFYHHLFFSFFFKYFSIFLTQLFAIRQTSTKSQRITEARMKFTTNKQMRWKAYLMLEKSHKYKFSLWNKKRVLSNEPLKLFNEDEEQNGTPYLLKLLLNLQSFKIFSLKLVNILNNLKILIVFLLKSTVSKLNN